MIKFIVGGKNDVVLRGWLANENSRCSWPEKNLKAILQPWSKINFNRNYLGKRTSAKFFVIQVSFFSKLNLN